MLKGILFAFAILWGINVQAEGELKYLRKMFPVQKETAFFVNSTYGRIKLNQWTKDSICIEATFRIKGMEDWERESLAAQVGLNFQTWPGTVKVETEIEKDFDRGAELSIELNIWIPYYLVADLVNRYGTIDVPYADIKTYLSLSAVYGDIRVDKLGTLSEADVYLNVSYGKLEVENCVKAQVKASYADISIQNSRNLLIKAEKSKIYIGTADTLIGEGKFNIYHIKDTAALRVYKISEEDKKEYGL